jgi:hypothetical protein
MPMVKQPLTIEHALLGFVRQRLAELQQQADTLADAQSYEWLVVCYRIGQLDATQDWLDRCSDWLMTIEQRSQRARGREAHAPDPGDAAAIHR